MKRVVVLLVVVLGLLGAFLYWMDSDTGRADRRGTTAAGQSYDASSGEPAAPDAATNGAPEDVQVDNDPNKIDGPPITIRGVVLGNGKPVAGARVALFPDRPWFRQRSSSWDRRRTNAARPIGDPTVTDETGRFEVEIARRLSVTVQAEAKGFGYGRTRVLLPRKGEFGEIEIHLPDEIVVTGLVVAADGKTPVPDAQVVFTSSAWNEGSAFRSEATTGAEGKLEAFGLKAGYIVLKVTAKGFATMTRSVNLPTLQSVLVTMSAGGVVHGVVTDAEGTPVADALVRVGTRDSLSSQGGAVNTTTDADGRYRAEGLMPGMVSSFELKHPLYGERSSSADRFVLPIKPVEAGQELRLDVQLVPGAPLHGIAVLASGEPAAGARVTVFRLHRQYRNLSAYADVQAGEDGRFTIPFVTEGSFSFEAFHEAGARRVNRYQNGQTSPTIDLFVAPGESPKEQRLVLEACGGIDGKLNFKPQQLSLNLQGLKVTVNAQADSNGRFRFSHVPVAANLFVQSWQPPAKSDPFEVKPGKITEVELDAGDTAPFKGVVEDSDGNPIVGASVVAVPVARQQYDLKNMLQNNWGSSKTDRRGEFEARPQQWYVQQHKKQEWVVGAAKPGYLHALVSKVKFPDEGQATEVRLTLHKGGTVSGRVILDGGGAASNRTVSLTPRKEKGQKFDFRANLKATTDVAGRFTIEGVGAGPYRLGVYYPEGKADPVDARAGDDGLELVVRPTQTISGLVVMEDGSPLQNATIRALVPGPKGERPHNGSIDQNGRFWIRHLAPGTYAIEVTPRKNQGWGQISAGFEKKRIDAVATGSSDVVITVSTGPSVRGKVLDADGNPRAGVAVLAMPVKLTKKERSNPWNTSRPSATTNGTGEFEITGAGEGEVEVLAILTGHQITTGKTTVGGAPVELRMARGEVIELRILAADGTPAANQWLNLSAQSPEVTKKLNDWQQRGGSSFQQLGGWNLISGQTDGNGKITFDSLMAGEYRLNLSATDKGALPPTKLRTGSGLTQIQLEPALTITGKLVDATGAALDIQQAWVSPQVEGTWMNGVQVDSTGEFELKGLPRGKVSIQVWANGYKPVRVEFEAGQQGVEIRLEKNTPRKPGG